jgi:hypothetical protein
MEKYEISKKENKKEKFLWRSVNLKKNSQNGKSCQSFKK